MTPKWEVARQPYRTFLGGTEDFDLYVTASGYLVIVAGPGGEDWAAYLLNADGKLLGLGEDDDNSATDIAVRERIIRKREEVEHYIRLFVPDFMSRFTLDA